MGSIVPKQISNKFEGLKIIKGLSRIKVTKGIANEDNESCLF